MCPYYDAKNKVCKLYGSSQSDYKIKTYCWGDSPFTECANYKQCKKTYGGFIPSKYLD